MTHGEEPGSEMHQDSAVLTYLEGLLMHQVAGGTGATATRRSEAGHNNRDPGNQGPLHASSQDQERVIPLGRATQHRKKARLLRSEAWNEPESQRLSAPVADLNGQSGDLLHKGALDGSNKCKGESTLLASLLQSFSSRLQTVALSQQIVQNLKQQDGSRVVKSAQEDEMAHPCYGTASSRLKGLMKKSKMQTHNSVPYRPRTSQERLSDSPLAVQSGAQPAVSDSISCAARLKAVANLVNIRSSPATSPKPSVACSQLALLLSSEAHLQQYSREQALKAQLSGRTASERLAAMATQQTQDKKQTSMGQAQIAPDMLSSLHAKNGTLPQTALASSPALVPGESRTATSPRGQYPFKEKRPFERHANRPSQNCSSLLLHLLNSHNTQKRINGQGHLQDDYGAFPGHGSPLLSDGEFSNAETSLPKDSSDAESSNSSCSPIDLSVRSKVSGSALGSSSSSSLDKLTESLINKWKPEVPRSVVSEARELESNAAIKPHHKVTLLQLLLDHKNNEKVNTSAVNPDLQHSISPKPNNVPVGRLTPVARCEDTRTQSPQGELAGRTLQPLLTFCRGGDSNGCASDSQSLPLDLCKPKPYTSECAAQEPAFSASKLLQNLAQCGLQNATSSPPPKTRMSPGKMQTHDPKLDKPMTLLDRLNAPLPRNKTPVSEGPYVNCAKEPFTPELPMPVSEIENLLERRTVLQLLLGTSSNQEKPNGKRKRAAVRGNASEKLPDKSGNFDGSNVPLLDVKIKNEPKEEGHPSDDCDGAVRCQSGQKAYESHSPLAIPQREVKLEPFPPEAVPKNGLLSQLLKQHTRTFPAIPLTDSRMVHVKEEQLEHQGSAIPKKRKFYMELHNHLNSKPCLGGSSASSTPEDRSSDPRASDSREGLKVRKPASPSEAEDALTCPAIESPPGDGRGFNVLKQLLLSDNCLKGLAQPRRAPSPFTFQANCRVNGNFHSEPGHNLEPLGLQWNQGPQGPRFTNLKTIATASASSSSSPGSPWGCHAARQESPKIDDAAIKREAEVPVQWVVGGEEKLNSHPDSPRLTKSNPILYYMLQKDNSHLGKEVQDRGAETVRCGMLVKVKEEPVAEAVANDHALSKHQVRGNAVAQGNPMAH